MNWTLVLHWIHVVAAVGWGGAVAAMTLIVWPLLLSRPAAESRVLWDTLLSRTGPVIGPLGLVTWIAGILRGTWLGPLQSWEALFGTAYGRWFVLALLLLVAMMAHMGITQKRLVARVWKGADYGADARRYVLGNGAITLGFLAALLICMVNMRFGG